MTRPYVRDQINNSWIDVFCRGGWKMKTLDGNYITLTAQNTKFRNATNTGWINFSCPIAAPSTILGGRVQSNRILDSVGFVWTAGGSIGYFEDGTTNSNQWQKTRYTKTGDYISNVKAIHAGGGGSSTRASTSMITYDGSAMFSGYSVLGQRGDGTGDRTPAGSDTLLLDVTENWVNRVGDLLEIKHQDRAGCMVMNDGRAFVLGVTQYDYQNDTGISKVRQAGFMGVAHDAQVDVNGLSFHKYANRWKRVSFFNGASHTELTGVKQMVKTSDGQIIALKEDGTFLQAPYWAFSTSTGAGIPAPKTSILGLRLMSPTFTQGVPKTLHQGAILETVEGDLFYAVPTLPAGSNDWFHDFVWKPFNINLKVYGSPLIRICGHTRISGTMKATVFFLLEDGRLYAQGENLKGWFGTTDVAVAGTTNTPVLINRNVLDFDIDVEACVVLKKDGSIWASGNNFNGRLGVGHNTNPISNWQQGLLKIAAPVTPTNP